jgi:hypothetical protein
MKAKMKCSSCGAEMENLNMSWGKKQWFFIIPIMILGFLPLAKMTFFKGDPTSDMIISEIRSNTNGGTIEITGLITNSGRHEWSSVTVEVEFFDKNGNFLDEKSEYLRTTIKPDAKEHFKVSIASKDERLLEEGVDVRVKIAGGHTSPF